MATRLLRNGNAARITRHALAGAVLCATTYLASGCASSDDQGSPQSIADGREIFRNDTFGDEQRWTDTLRMHEVIESAVDPTTALSVGLKVDSEVLPAGLLASADLRSPATTVALIKLNAVVGIKGTVVSEGGRDRLTRVGITCALCHSTVDNSVAPGIGKRLDGWPNTTLNPGAIIALSPVLTSQQRAVYNSWGPGRYDPRFNQDGINGPVVIPPAYGLRGVVMATFTGDGDISYWNRYVAVTQMGAQGAFTDTRIAVDHPLPSGTADLVTSKLPALKDYQLSLVAPQAPAVDSVAVGRGQAIFNGAGRCASCHRGTTFTDDQLHSPGEVGTEPGYAARSATKRYRTTPLRGLASHAPYFHDGSAPTLAAVVEHYDKQFSLGLTASQKADLTEYLKSL